MSREITLLQLESVSSGRIWVVSLGFLFQLHKIPIVIPVPILIVTPGHSIAK